MSGKELKGGYRRQIDELRDLWNAFDPISVMDDPDWPRDEYDRYLPPTLSLLMDNAGTLAIADHVNSAVCDEMALPGDAAGAYVFACKLKAWFADKLSDKSGEIFKPN